MGAAWEADRGQGILAGGAVGGVVGVGGGLPVEKVATDLRKVLVTS